MIQVDGADDNQVVPLISTEFEIVTLSAYNKYIMHLFGAVMGVFDVIRHSEILTDDDRAFLFEYDQCMNTETRIQSDKDNLANTMQLKLNDIKFNHRMIEFEKEMQKSKVEFPYFDVLKALSVEMKKPEYFDSFIKTAQQRIKRIRQNGKLDKNAQLTASELGALQKARELERFMTILVNEKGIHLGANQNYQKLQKQSKEILGLENQRMILLSRPDLDIVIKESKVLTDDDQAFLFEYNQIMNTSAMRTPEDKVSLTETMMRKLEDKDFNHRIMQFEQEMKKRNVQFPYLDFLKGLSFEMPKTEYFESFIIKAQRGLNIIKDDGKLDEHEKLTVSDLGLVKKADKLKNIMHKLDKEKGIDLTKNPKYLKLRQQCETMQSLEKQIKGLLKWNVYQSGDIVASNMKKTASYNLKHTQPSNFSKQELLDMIKGLFTDYGHSAQLVTSGDVNPQKSHMWDTHKMEELKLGDMIEGEVFRIDIDKLQNLGVPPEQQNALKAALDGRSLQELYAEKIALIANDKLLDGLRIISGLKAAPTLLPHWFGRVDNENLGLFTTTNGKETLYKSKMVCSDFIARETYEAIRLVNLELKQKILTIMQEKNTKTTIDAINDPLNYPFPEYMNLSRVDPGELIKLLNKSGCLVKVESTELNALVNTRGRFESLVEHIELTTALYVKLSNLAKDIKTEQPFVEQGRATFLTYLAADNVFDIKAHQNNHALQHKVNSYIERELTTLYPAFNRKQPNSFLDAFCTMICDGINQLNTKDSEHQRIKIMQDTVLMLRTIYSTPLIINAKTTEQALFEMLKLLKENPTNIPSFDEPTLKIMTDRIQEIKEKAAPSDRDEHILDCYDLIIHELNNREAAIDAAIEDGADIQASLALVSDASEIKTINFPYFSDDLTSSTSEMASFKAKIDEIKDKDTKIIEVTTSNDVSVKCTPHINEENVQQSPDAVHNLSEPQGDESRSAAIKESIAALREDNQAEGKSISSDHTLPKPSHNN